MLTFLTSQSFYQKIFTNLTFRKYCFLIRLGHARENLEQKKKKINWSGVRQRGKSEGQGRHWKGESEVGLTHMYYMCIKRRRKNNEKGWKVRTAGPLHLSKEAEERTGRQDARTASHGSAYPSFWEQTKPMGKPYTVSLGLREADLSRPPTPWLLSGSWPLSTEFKAYRVLRP